MSKLLKVLKVEMREKVTEVVRKSTRHDYARGGYRVEETICRTTQSTPFALLECGHWRQERNSGAKIISAKKLSCHKCEHEEWTKRRAELDGQSTAT